MAEGKWISYLRVSTDRQGKSRLGIEAQRNAVGDYLDGGNWSVVKEFVEVESGKRSDRPMLAKAVQACRAYGAKLSLRNWTAYPAMHTSCSVAGVDFVAADMPNPNRLTVAEEERRMISRRTKDALAAAKRRGTKLGGDRGVVPSRKARAMGVEALRARADAKAADLAPIIKELQTAWKTSLRSRRRSNTGWRRPVRSLLIRVADESAVVRFLGAAISAQKAVDCLDIALDPSRNGHS
jgi:Resolvase, N terminal domain